MKPIIFALSCLCLSLAACGNPSPPAPEPSQLDIRQAQTREYETKDSKMVMKAVLNVLQDDGFIVKNAVPELGLLTATKEEKMQPIAGPGWKASLGSILIKSTIAAMSGAHGGFGDERREPTSQHGIIEASANVSEFGNVTRVRVNFERKVMDNLGGTLEVQQMLEGKYYQEFFAKVDKGIFIQKEKL